MAVLDDLKDQKLAGRILGGIIRTGRIATTYLFTGPEGTDKRSAALLFAQALNCDNSGCGSCQSCRQIKDGVHPDLKITGVLKDKKEISIDQMRSVQDEAYLKPFSARYKIMIVDDAGFLSAPAANSLLKILEEPPEQTIFMLLTSRQQAIPPTILSRCQRVRFVSSGTGKIQDTAGEYSEIFGFLDGRDQDMPRGLIKQSGSREDCVDLLDSIAAYFRDVLLAAEGSGADSSAAGRDRGLLVSILRRVLRAREQAARYVSPQLLTELLFIELKRMRAGATQTESVNG